MDTFFLNLQDTVIEVIFTTFVLAVIFCISVAISLRPDRKKEVNDGTKQTSPRSR